MSTKHNADSKCDKKWLAPFSNELCLILKTLILRSTGAVVLHFCQMYNLHELLSFTCIQCRLALALANTKHQLLKLLYNLVLHILLNIKIYMFFLAVAVTKVWTCLITIKTQRKQTHVKLTCMQCWLALALATIKHQLLQLLLNLHQNSGSFPASVIIW